MKKELIVELFQRRIEDFALTRYACYLIAQNGDPTKKSEIAFAQTCFAVRCSDVYRIRHNFTAARFSIQSPLCVDFAA